MNTNENNQKIGIAWYQKDQWEKLKQVSIDSNKLDDTYEDWLKNANNTIIQIINGGKDVEKVYIDVNELMEWCKKNNLPLDGKARSRFSTVKLQQKSIF